MSCNSESRRAINYSQQEPINNKYDLWLSENLRYNSEGQQVYDSPGQPACDLILKIYKDGDWKPIAGLNTEHIVANKINIVNGVNYTYISSNDNTQHTNDGFQQNHLPLFRNPQDSPNELFDAGTLGEAIYGFVNESEWKNIFEGDAFSNSFEKYFENIVNEGDIDINILLKPAEENKLGGIWADEFSIENMFPNSEAHDSHSQTEINDSYNWIAQAKYKLNHGTSDYNLYVSAKDIIGAINHYQIENPDAPGIQPGDDFELWLADTERIGGIKAEQDPNTSDDCRNIPIVLAGPTVGSVWGLDFGTPGRRYLGDSDYNTEYLYLPGWALMEWMKNPYFDQQNTQLFITGWKGVDTQLRENSDLIWVGLSGVTPENTGKFCTVQLDNTDPSGASIEWVNLPEIETYDLLESGSSALGKYVVKGGGKVGEYLDYEGNWTQPVGTEYEGSEFIRINQNHIGIRPNDGIDTRKTYICSHNGELSWDVIDTGTQYQAGVGIKFGNGNSINIDITEADTQGQVLSYDGNGGVEWKDVSYTSGNVIEITNNNTIQISSDNAENGDIIICDSGSVKWGAVPNPVINSVDIDDNNDNLTLNGFTLRNTSNNIIVDDVPTQSSYEISTWTYYSLDNFKSFTIENAPDAREPIYIRIEDATGLACNCDHIDPQDILTSQSGAVLITLQFGIAKFEQITTPQSSEPEPEPSEP